MSASRRIKACEVHQHENQRRWVVDHKLHQGHGGRSVVSKLASEGVQNDSHDAVDALNLVGGVVMWWHHRATHPAPRAGPSWSTGATKLQAAVLVVTVLKVGTSQSGGRCAPAESRCRSGRRQLEEVQADTPAAARRDRQGEQQALRWQMVGQVCKDSTDSAPKAGRATTPSREPERGSFRVAWSSCSTCSRSAPAAGTQRPSSHRLRR